MATDEATQSSALEDNVAEKTLTDDAIAAVVGDGAVIDPQT